MTVTFASIVRTHGPGIARLAGLNPADVTDTSIAADLFEAVEALDHRGDRARASRLEEALSLLTQAGEAAGTMRSTTLLDQAEQVLLRHLADT